MANTFDLQWELLKEELEQINHAIERIDGIAQGIKNWTILIWAGSLAILFDKDHAAMRRYAWATAAIPLLFWISDATWRSIQRSFIVRVRLISKFANGPALETSRAEGRFVDFVVLDPRASTSSHTREYRSYTSLLHVLLFRTIAFFYLALICISVALGVWFT
jgi:hypothetical protein